MNRTLEPFIQIVAICMAVALLTCAGKAWGGEPIVGAQGRCGYWMAATCGGEDAIPGRECYYFEPAPCGSQVTADKADCYWEVLSVGMFVSAIISKLDDVGKSDNEADERAVGILRKIPVGWEPFAVNSWMPERGEWQKDHAQPYHIIWLKRRVCP